MMPTVTSSDTGNPNITAPIQGRHRKSYHDDHVWTHVEDLALKYLVTCSGEKEPQWEGIAAEIDGKTAESCHERWSRLLEDPALTDKIPQQDATKIPAQVDVENHCAKRRREASVSSVDCSSSSGTPKEDTLQHSRETTNEALAYIDDGEEANTSEDDSMPFSSSRAVALQVNEEAVYIPLSTALKDGWYTGWYSAYPPRFLPSIHGEDNATNNPIPCEILDHTNEYDGLCCEGAV
ncbi:hypothetical protein BC938DRAFT_480541 [Jimgerdemannia flammicorona]|uniref:Myb-like domain-containing protein n=1 Tax=Jimgerdemannia flammicorona TaxID=994334 RepID=A0A433QI91_9FUNG|nr:hypothetical protein BC938DRAFT_480541 [Jimgerdemannia flammicorona]